MKIKINKLFYQRNGISGNGFFICDFNLREGKQFFPHLIATFETEEREEKDILNCTTCRVIEPENLFNGYRGDYIGVDLQRELESKNKRFWELTEEYKLLKKRTKKSA